MKIILIIIGLLIWVFTMTAAYIKGRLNQSEINRDLEDIKIGLDFKHKRN